MILICLLNLGNLTIIVLMDPLLINNLSRYILDVYVPNILQIVYFQLATNLIRLQSVVIFLGNRLEIQYVSIIYNNYK